MKIYCGSVDDVHPYQRIQRPRSTNPHPATTAQAGPSATGVDALMELPPVSRLGGKKRGGSFKQKVAGAIMKPSSNLTASKSGTVSADSPSVSAVFPSSAAVGPHLPRELPSRKVGIVDFLMGYHALLQITPATSSFVGSQRRELHPTIGFAHMQQQQQQLQAPARQDSLQ